MPLGVNFFGPAIAPPRKLAARRELAAADLVEGEALLVLICLWDPYRDSKCFVGGLGGFLAHRKTC